MSRYQSMMLLEREVLDGLHITPVDGALKVSVARGCWRIEHQVLEAKAATELDLTAKKPEAGEGGAKVTVVVPVYANPNGKIELTPEADKAAAWQPLGHGAVDTGTKSRSIKIGEVTLSSDSVAFAAADISEAARYAFDQLRTKLNNQHNTWS